MNFQVQWQVKHTLIVWALSTPEEGSLGRRVQRRKNFVGWTQILDSKSNINNVMDGTCSMHAWKKLKYFQNFIWKMWAEERAWETWDVRRILLKRILKRVMWEFELEPSEWGEGSKDYFEHSNESSGSINDVIYWLTGWLSASQEGFYSTELVRQQETWGWTNMMHWEAL